MKNILTLIALLSVAFSGISASSDAYDRQLEVIKEAFNSKDCGKYAGWLSEDCAALGKSGRLFMPTMKALFAALDGNTIEDMRLLSTDVAEDSTMTFTYDISYSRLGPKQGCFSINREGLISRLDYIATAKARSVGRVDTRLPPEPVVNIPFILSDNGLIVIRGRLNGEERSFIFDSGAKTSMLNSRYLSDKTVDNGQAAINGVNSGSMELSVVSGTDLDIAGIKVVGGEMPAKDLRHLEPVDTPPVYGLIGVDIFGGYDILFDYDNLMLTLINPSARVNAGAAVTVPFENLASGYLPTVKVNVAGEELVLGIDCGATVNLLFDRYATLIGDIEEADLVGISGDATIERQGRANLSVGTVDFGSQPFIVKDISHLQNLDVDGLIGFPALKTRRIMLRYSAKELVIF